MASSDRSSDRPGKSGIRDLLERTRVGKEREELALRVESLVRASDSMQAVFEGLQRMYVAGDLDRGDILVCERLLEGMTPGRGVDRPREGGKPADLVRDALGQPGRPLDASMRARMESLLGQDLGRVRAHSDPDSARSAQAVGARAYTVGTDIVLGEPGIAAGNAEGEMILLHELAHVMQQHFQTMSPDVASLGASSPSLEADADAAMSSLLGGRAAAIREHTGGPAIQAWAGGEHKLIGDKAAAKAAGKKRTASPFGQSMMSGSEQVCRRPVDPTTNLSAWILENSNPPPQVETKEGRISFGDASRYAGDYDQTVEKLDEESGVGKNDTKGFDKGAEWKAAASNINHFYPLNHQEYRTHHELALQHARVGDRHKAMLEEGFASHFLEDAFASGHMAPRALDRIHARDAVDERLNSPWASMEDAADPAGTFLESEAGQGLTRTKNYHDQLNKVAVDTTLGRFHGDSEKNQWTQEYEVIAGVVAASLQQVLKTLEDPAYKATEIDLPKPLPAKIKADPTAGPIWKRMEGSYAEDLKSAKGKHSKENLVTDAGTTAKTGDIAKAIESDVFGNTGDTAVASQPNAPKATEAGASKPAPSVSPASSTSGASMTGKRPPAPAPQVAAKRKRPVAGKKISRKGPARV